MTVNLLDPTFWTTIGSAVTPTNEAEVERLVVEPFLAALGYQTCDIESKVKVTFRQGTKTGRPFEADFVVYAGPLRDQDTSLMVVEVKTPGASLEDAREQGESYAMRLKTPVLLVTDGIALQIWQIQPSLSSELVLEAPVKAIQSCRGEVETLIGKAALLEYAKSISFKKLQATPDFGRYEAAELQRTQKYEKAISRSLHRVGKTSESIVDSDTLIESPPPGALVIAPSGYGKTVLAAKILRQAIKNRWIDATRPIAAELGLLDFSQSDDTVLAYIYKRISPHQPGISLAALEEKIRLHGVVLLCDCYERIPPAKRLSVDSQLRNFIRDYPVARVFVFSRGSALPDLQLARLDLKSLTPEQRHEMASARSDKLTYIGAPRLLFELSEIPLILSRVLDFLESTQSFPERLEQLFEHWLSELLGPDRNSTTAIRRHSALGQLATAMDRGPLTSIEALSLVTKAGLGDASLDDLLQSGVLLCVEGYVEPVHEGLIDFVRARNLASLAPGQLASALSETHIESDSLFPILLLALIKDHAARQLVWERLKSLPFHRYAEAIRFGGRGLDSFDDGEMPVIGMRFLSELAAGINDMASAYFPQVEKELKGCLARHPWPVSELTIAGVISGGGGDFQYRISPKKSDEGAVQWGFSDQQAATSYMALGSFNLGPDDGRYLAATKLRDAVNDLVKTRRFSGGGLLANERSIGRLRFMQEVYSYQIHSEERIIDILERLEPIKNRVVMDDAFSQSVVFPVESLVNDLDFLLQSGEEKLNWWWLKYGSDADEIAREGDRLVNFLKEHYQRMDSLYLEIVKESFIRLVPELGHARVMPVRWLLAAIPGLFERSPSIHYQWLPVSTEDERDVVCIFSENFPKNFLHDDQHYVNLKTELRRLGRDFGGYTIGGMRQLPRVSIRDDRGRITGETSVLRDACEMLSEDLKRLFDELPSHRPSIDVH